MKLFSENVVMMLSSKETEESKGSIWIGSHSTNAFLHCAKLKIEKFNFPQENIDRQLDLRIFDNEGPGLIAAVDYQVLEVNDLIVHVKELPKDTKFLFIIDACFGANFMKLFSENVVMMLSSKETEESKGSIWYGSHSTNAFLHCAVRDSETY
ncbi:unnamed protein product [Trifolium pratense]|uniref:Uncharacterized protein n=1 Tax=Trifolium pratense TaxID=57577 RepID=A0ACB0IB50_TRIPR|nr:unnamed protein product [Trifolium pratense]